MQECGYRHRQRQETEITLQWLSEDSANFAEGHSEGRKRHEELGTNKCFHGWIVRMAQDGTQNDPEGNESQKGEHHVAL